MNDHGDESKCPVSHDARKIWAEQNGPTAKKPVLASGRPQVPVNDEKSQTSQQSDVCSSDSNYLDPANNMPLKPEQSPNGSNCALDTHREVSSIPRANRNENWTYPSQQMFFNAMQRKQWNPNPKDMSVVVPIHNAVNERAWQEILQWEDNKSAPCGGPKLISFHGKPNSPSPKASIRGLFGYSMPFDRHDWVIDRCGKKVTYVIDFYTGAPDPSGRPSFYLDVRPALTPSGLLERIEKAWMDYRKPTT